MNLRRLECFVAVTECLNFTAAAKRIAISQSALSKQIAALEDELGTRLFERDKRSVTLTLAGEILYHETQEILQKVSEAAEKVRSAKTGSTGNLTIGFLALVAAQFLPQLAAGFLRSHPRIDLNLLPMYQANISEGLGNGKIDLAFTRRYNLKAPDYVCKTVYADHFCLVMPRDHPLAAQEKIPFSMLVDQPFVSYRKEVSQDLLNKLLGLCAHAGFSPNIVKQTTRVESLLFLIEAGVGISMLNRAVEQVYGRSSLAFVDIDSDEDIRNDLVLAWKSSNTNHCIPVFVRHFETVCDGFFPRS
jgi:DNA-binding transcriptional LysR family regulator